MGLILNSTSEKLSQMICPQSGSRFSAQLHKNLPINSGGIRSPQLIPWPRCLPFYQFAFSLISNRDYREQLEVVKMYIGYLPVSLWSFRYIFCLRPLLSVFRLKRLGGRLHLFYDAYRLQWEQISNQTLSFRWLQMRPSKMSFQILITRKQYAILSLETSKPHYMSFFRLKNIFQIKMVAKKRKRLNVILVTHSKWLFWGFLSYECKLCLHD